MLDLEAKKEWLAKIGVLLPPTGKSGASSSGGAAPAGSAAPVGGAAPAAPTSAFKGPVDNPFDAPEAVIEFDKCTLSVIQQLAVQQAQNARADFATALAKVKAAKKAEADAEQARRELMWSIAITIALMPAGPVVEAAANAVAGPALQSKMMVALANNAANLEAKFGAKGAQAANKAFDFVAGDAVTSLAKKFDAAKAKSALGAGMGALQGKVVKFAASSDKGTCVANYLDAMLKSANDSMHNLTNVILTTKSYSEALAFYNYFSSPLQGIYEAVLMQQADDMLSEVADVLAKNAATGLSSMVGQIGKEDDIVKVSAYGRTLFAHIKRFMKPDAINESHEFVKWVTPDMEPMAVKLAKEELAPNAFENHLPDPLREPGERVVLVDGWGRERVMLIQVEDQGIFWKDYGVRVFKKWADSDEDDKALRSRGAMQIGGLEKLPVSSIKDVKPPAS